MLAYALVERTGADGGFSGVEPTEPTVSSIPESLILSFLIVEMLNTVAINSDALGNSCLSSSRHHVSLRHSTLPLTQDSIQNPKSATLFSVTVCLTYKIRNSSAFVCPALTASAASPFINPTMKHGPIRM